MSMSGIGVLVFLGLLLLSGFRIADQYQWAGVFRLGKYRRATGPGLYYLIPFIEIPFIERRLAHRHAHSDHRGRAAGSDRQR
jgi:regulator of protease activity HflC (stomatin/prohibitin superfamily)